MLLGIDVGGTHTDAVLLSHDDTGFSVVSWTKTETDHNSVVDSVCAALGAVLRGQDAAGVTRLTLSTTLSTNALAQNRLDNAALVLVPGPGMNVEEWTSGLPCFVLPGAVDHRGRETAPLDDTAIASMVERIIKGNIRTVAVAGKFSTRNPCHENALADALRNATAPDCTSLSHALSGVLNFPRRAVAAYYNAALWNLHRSFADSVRDAVKNIGNEIEPLLLMAHGGSVPLDASRSNCVEAANSGPAASVLGIMALEGERFAADGAVLFCDIGGSTTDLALMAHGSPVAAREGLSLGGRLTSVPGLATTSIPIGGDCPVAVNSSGIIEVETRRLGPCFAMGGPAPTLTDALNILGHATWGDTALSLQSLQTVAESFRKITGTTVSAFDVAHMATEAAGKRIRDEAAAFIEVINARPVYTVAQLLSDERLVPARICAVGGAGAPMAQVIEKAFGLPVVIPSHSGVANAIGAALARLSAFASLYADTAQGVVHILPDGGTRRISSDYTLKQAVTDAESYVHERINALDPQAPDLSVDIVESDSFTMYDDRGNRLGKNIRVLCRARPGLVKIS